MQSKTENDAVLIHQCWPGRKNEAMLQIIEQRHQDYCTKHNFDFWVIKHSLTDYPQEKKTWERLVLLKQAIAAGYKYIVWMDTDAIIRDSSKDLREACVGGIGACYDEHYAVHHYNCGVMYFENTPIVSGFVDIWHSRYPGGLWEGQNWHEQTEFNKLLTEYPTIIHRLDNVWNSYPTTPADPDKIIVRAWHGPIPADAKIVMMQQYISSLPAIEIS